MARKIFGRLDGRRVLVIGAGEISSLTAEHLRSQGVGEIVITSRTAAQAEVLAASVGGRAARWEDVPSLLTTADIVITATGSQRPILTRAQEVLHQLEQGAPSSDPSQNQERSEQDPSLPAPHPVLSEMKQMDLFSMTPLEAMNRLADLKRRLDQE